MDQGILSQYNIDNHITFLPDGEELARAVIVNQFGRALITLAGAHVMSYIPHEHQELLWSSPTHSHIISDAMRGGIPVCWPWFGNHPIAPTKYQIHGLARAQIFRVRETRALEDGSTIMSLFTQDTPETRSLWPHKFELEVNVHLGSSLQVEWIARNPGNTAYTYTGALHPYILTGDSRQVFVNGLAGTDYLDYNDHLQRKHQIGPVTFQQPIDNIYLNTSSNLQINDPVLKREINLQKTGSQTTVVWNPGIGDADMNDVGKGEHLRFICVEAANATDDVIQVDPGGERRLSLEFNVKSWRDL
jgi:glucose-6-phosphate 1-epimerase